MPARTDAWLIDADGGSKGPPSSVGLRAPSELTLTVAALASQQGAQITLGDVCGCAYPLFYAANAKGVPPSIALESTSDSHMRSMMEEAVRCWDAAHEDAEKRAGWLHTLGAHPCVYDRLVAPFNLVESTLTGVDPRRLSRELISLDKQPDLRILGYRLAEQWIARGLKDAGDRLSTLLMERPAWAM